MVVTNRLHVALPSASIGNTTILIDSVSIASRRLRTVIIEGAEHLLPRTTMSQPRIIRWKSTLGLGYAVAFSGFSSCAIYAFKYCKKRWNNLPNCN